MKIIMSGSSVVVLAPNGRRQIVKCNPNTTILQIIEEVCYKQGFKPEEYDIKHHNKVLDTTMTFRFSGLPNNAQLELSTALKNRTEGNIILAINLENGSRITDVFTPNDTLLNVLNKVCPENAAPEKNPVVIYTRQEIYGNELENCTLRSLGLTGGRAMIRVLNRDPELLRQQANVSAPLPSKPVEEKPYIRKFQPLEEDKNGNKTEYLENRPQNDEGGKDSEIKDISTGNRLGGSEENQNPTIEVKPQKNIKNTSLDILKLAKEKRKSEDASLDKRIQGEKKKIVESKTKFIDRNIEEMDVDSPGITLEKKVSVKEKSIEEEFVFCGERNGMIFSLESAHSVPSEDLPEDFFELTIDDAKKILRDVKRRRFELENQVLRTSQLRNLEESKKQLRQLNRYKKAIIRVQFPDRTVIQGTFKPTETIQDVLDFIRGYIEDQTMDFYIYSTPPKAILNNESRLIEVGCVPGALLYFGTGEDKKEELLKKEFQNMFTTNSVASLAAARIRQENTRNVQNEPGDDNFMDIIDDTAAPVNFGASTSNNASRSTDSKINNSSQDFSSNKVDFPWWRKPV